MSLWISLSGFSFLVGCGSGLVGLDYRGEALVSIVGEVLHDTPIGIDVDKPAIGLFWRRSDGTISAEQSVVVDTNFPARYVLQVFLPPVDGVLQPLAAYGGVDGALGILLLYQDNGDNGAWDAGEDPLLGANTGFIGWFDEAPPDETLEARRYLNVPSACRRPPQNPEVPDDAPEGQLHQDLVVGEVCSMLLEVDCDTSTSDWPELCP